MVEVLLCSIFICLISVSGMFFRLLIRLNLFCDRL